MTDAHSMAHLNAIPDGPLRDAVARIIWWDASGPDNSMPDTLAACNSYNNPTYYPARADLVSALATIYGEREAEGRVLRDYDKMVGGIL